LLEIFHMKLLLLVVMLTGSLGVGAQSPVVEGDSLRLISRQFSFAEGAAVDRRGNVFFTDQPNNRIWEYNVKGELSVFLNSAGRSNGMYFDRKGRLVTCADEEDQLWAIGPHKKVTVLMRDLGGRRLNGPNDLWIDAGGGVYFTDPYYQRPYWSRTHPDLESANVYYLPAGQQQAVVVAGEMKAPNGIVGSPDGRILYVSDLQAGKTYKFTIGTGGQLSTKELFVSQGSDGMTLDEKGNVYLCGKGVTVYDAAGKKIAHIAVPEDWTGNLCFGGKDRKTLFITASKGLYTLRMQVKGVE
jgi:gluconolactonase